MNVDLYECSYSVDIRNHEKPCQNNPKLPDIGNVKFYFPCMKYKGMNRRRINSSTNRKHCYEHGKIKGGTKYYPW
jgi:hypothetical protein